MSAQANLIPDPILETDFIIELVRQMRAIDSYGTYDGVANDVVLTPFIMTKAMRRELPIIGDPDEEILSRLRAFYNAIASLIEKECSLMAVPMMNISYEGFGRVIISVGKLLVLDRTLRDVHRFGYPSLSKMKDEADSQLAVALEIIGNHSEVAGL